MSGHPLCEITKMYHFVNNVFLSRYTDDHFFLTSSNRLFENHLFIQFNAYVSNHKMDSFLLNRKIVFKIIQMLILSK